jgi:hypothetical protein
MDRNQAHYPRRRETVWRRYPATLLVIGVLACLGALLAFRCISGPTSLPTLPSAKSLDAPYFFDEFQVRGGSALSADRPVFPYSIIPQGAVSTEELRLALERDAIAAAHYTNFKIHSTRIVRLDKDRQAYVSYRKGNKIYRTRKKVTLHAGETLLSDGTHLARTRCGNRISDVPVLPTSDAEPTAVALNSPVLPSLLELSTDPYSFQYQLPAHETIFIH